MRKNKLTGLSDKMSDAILVTMCTLIMLIVAYPLYYVLIASISDPYDALLQSLQNAVDSVIRAEGIPMVRVILLIEALHSRCRKRLHRFRVIDIVDPSLIQLAEKQLDPFPVIENAVRDLIGCQLVHFLQSFYIA